MTGTSRHGQQLLVVPQPHSRDLRLGFLAGLAQIVLGYIADRQNRTEVLPATRNREERRRYADAPQVIVPNRAARDYLGLLGRSTRFLPTDGPYAVDPAVPSLGKWLTFLADSADHPGAALLADLTSLLAEHWASGQSPLEDASLAAQLAWIDPPPGMTGLQAALATEDPLRCPPAGPATDPGFDQAILEPLVRSYDRAAQPAARPAWTVPPLRSAPPSKASWNRHGMRPGTRSRCYARCPRRPRQAAAGPPTRTPSRGSASYLADGGLPQPRRDHAATAAARLDRLERAQAAYDAERALEDPFVLAELRTSGEAFAGEVVSAEPSRTIITAAGQPVLRPRFTVRTGDPVRLEPGRVLICPAHHRQRVQIADLTRTAADADDRPRSCPGNGHTRQADARRGTCCRGTGQLHARPRVLCPRDFPPPDQTPWTHGGPPVRPAASPGEETPS